MRTVPAFVAGPETLKVGETISLHYPDSQAEGEPTLRTGEIDRVTDKFAVVNTTDRGFRTFVFARIPLAQSDIIVH